MFASEMALTVDTFMPPLRSGDLFNELSYRGRQRLEGPFNLHYFSKNEVIYERNSATAAIWVLVSGRARVLIVNPFDGEIITREALPDEVFGLTETLASMQYMTTLIAGTVCVFQSIDHRELVKLLQQEQMFRMKLLRVLSEIHMIAYDKLVRLPMV